MSGKYDKRLSLTGIDITGLSDDELAKRFREVLEAGLHGLCFSPYIGDQKPGTLVTEEQIRRRLAIIAPYCSWIRTFSCTEGNQEIPRIARDSGLKTLVGAWLGTEADKNEEEIANVIAVGNAGNADVIAVGNEVMYREEMSEDELIACIQRVRDAVPGIPVGYVDAYYEFCHRPALADACDVIMANCYPFWEGCSLEYSLLYMKDMFRRVTEAAGGKPVIISETGWPESGTALGGAIPSRRGAMSYFIGAQDWSREANIDMFYFSTFDEAWKVAAEGDVGSSWGIWDAEGMLKW